MTNASQTDAAAPDTIILIHGMWMTPRSWDGWAAHYRALGYQVLAPAWPGLEVEVESLNADHAPLVGLKVQTILDHYEAIIRSLPRPPILIGHSYGGAFVQLLLDRGLGAAGVALHSAPVKGVLPAWQTVKATLPVTYNPLHAWSAVPLTPAQFHATFANTVSREASDAIHARYHVPAAGYAFFQGIVANVVPNSALKVNKRNHDRAPLLFLSGDADTLLPASMQRRNARMYRKSRAITEYVELAGRSHGVVLQDGWQEVADLALAWALDHARTAPVAVTAPAPALPVAARTIALAATAN